VVEGNLSGADTTIIVQFFGAASVSAPSIPVAEAKTVATIVPTKKPETLAVLSTPTPSPVPTPTPTATPNNEVVSTSYLASPFDSTKNISLGVVGVLLLVLSIDLIVVRRRRIMRIGGRTLAHIAFLGMVLAVLLILKAGQII